VISLPAPVHETLRQVHRAGAAGVAYADLRLGDAILLATDELIRVSSDEQRVYIAAKGAAYLLRDAA
jgi:hypothetical protein